MSIIINDDEDHWKYTFVLENGRIYSDDFEKVCYLEMEYDWNDKHIYCDNLTDAINKYAEECESVIYLRYN